MNRVLAIASVVLRELLRRKDAYVLFVLTALLTLLAGSMSFFGEGGYARYLREICLLLIWVSSLVIAVTLAARQLPVEIENRTVFPLLAKPVTRGEVVLGKFLGAWTASAACLVAFYVLLALLGAGRGPGPGLALYAQALALHATFLAVVTAMTLWGSLVFAAPSSTVTIVLVVVLGILSVARHLNKVAMTLAEPGQTLAYLLYYALPHLEFFDLRDLLIHDWPPVPWGPFAGAVLYGGAYAALFLALACRAFRRKRLA